MSSSREHFGSKLGFILAAAGSAVGIGNLVGFPVAAAKNGGAAFLITYTVFVVFICLPIMLAEMAMGRHTQKDPFGAYTAMTPKGSPWRIGGFLAILTPFMIGVFYTVITVWIFGYMVQTVTGNLDALADPNHFGQFINQPTIFGYMVFVVLAVVAILAAGVKEGIERAAKFLMPALFIMLAGLVVYVLTLDNAFAGVKFYLVPDFSKITASVINGALSQAFFSLSLGMGILITYGSYLRSQDDVVGGAKMVAITDTAVAFIAGLMTMPAIFAFNPNTNTQELSDSSVSMVFVFLPKIFLALQGNIGFFGASVVAFVFFTLVFFAAITSLVSIIEVPVAAMMDKADVSRRKSLLTVGLAMLVFTVLSALSFGMWSPVTELTHYANANKSLFDVIVDVFYDTILPLNGLILCLFVAYRWKRSELTNELSNGNSQYQHGLLVKYVNFALGTVIPVILALVFINTVADKFFAVKLLDMLFA